MNDGVAMLSAAPLAAPAAERFPRWPAGWYRLADSRQIGPRPRGFDWLGRRIVCFRTAGGAVVAMDGRCWHLGADLAGGTVRDDRLVCPFHGWQFGTDGRCLHIPAQSHVPACARQQTYATAERAGAVFIYPNAEADYPLPFFDGVAPGELLAAPPFAFDIACPWWLVGTNGFDLQHFAGAHDRQLVGAPTVSTPHPAARRIVSTFEVVGDGWRDALTRRLAGRFVTMDATVWAGTLALVMARFADAPGDPPPNSTSFGQVEIRPVPGPTDRTHVRVVIWTRRRGGLGLRDRLDVRVRRSFIRAFLEPDTRLLDGARYRPDRLVDADRVMIDYLTWLATAATGGRAETNGDMT